MANQIAGPVCPECDSDGPHFLNQHTRLDVTTYGSEEYAEILYWHMTCKCEHTWTDFELQTRPIET